MSTRSNSVSTQSTPPTPPNGRRGRRLRKSTTPIKSAEKVEQHEKVVTVPQGPTLTVPPSTSSPSDITPSSSGTNTPAKQEPNNGGKGSGIVSSTPSFPSLRAHVTPPPPPIPVPSSSSLPVKKHKRIPYTLVEASKGKRCPTPGCNGMGHSTGLYTMHYAESGCPIAAQKKKELEKSQTQRSQTSSIISLSKQLKKPHGRKRRKKKSHKPYRKITKEEQPSKKREALSVAPVEGIVGVGSSILASRSSVTTDPTLATPIKQEQPILNVDEILSSLPHPPSGGVLGKRKRIPYTLVEANKGNKCPTVGCNGMGHITGMYAMHYAVSGCPLAHGKTPEECKARREEMNKAKQFSGSVAVTAVTTPTSDIMELYENTSSLPRKTLRLQSSRNLSVSLENITGSSPVITPQQSKVSLPPNNQTRPSVLRVPEYHFLPEPNLEGFTPTQDLLLFREAQRKMNEELGIASGIKKEYCLSKITFGCYEIDTWYPSPYSPEYTQLSQIYICEFCLRYFRSFRMLERHETGCRKTRPYPPGREIYRKYKYSVFEVDGEDHKEYCQNLCLLAKLFLDHKTLYSEVEPFLFYILTEYDKTGCHLIGYFSKEKHSSQGYNVSCILTLPHYMRKGFGRMLIDFSYMLTRLEEKIGSPERPLSDLGLVSYRSYWKDVILTYLIKNSLKSGNTISVKDMSQDTGVAPDDLVSTLQYFSLLKYWKSKHIIIKKKDLLEEHSSKLEERKSSPLTLDQSRLKWTPNTYPSYP